MRWVRLLAKLVAICAVVGGASFVAYRAGERAVRTAPPPPIAAAPQTVVARAGELVDAGPMQVTAEWNSTTSYVNRLPGTVTGGTTTTSGRRPVDAGSVLYRVDEIPVVAMPGTIPAYRDLGPNVIGFDVAQLQQFLTAQGVFKGPIDGKWAVSTSVAWKAWRDSEGFPKSTSAPLGSIVFLPSLPASVRLESQITSGAVVGDGTPAIDVLDDVPVFKTDVPAGTTLGVAPGLDVVVDVSGTTLHLTTSKQSVAADGSVNVTLALPPNTTCASWCDALPTGTATHLSGTITRAGPASGVIVPVGAIRSGSGTDLFVLVDDGTKTPVKIRLQVGADALVDGIADGTRVQLPVPPG